MFRDNEYRPMPAQFAFRVAVMSAVALVMFSVIFFRLWYLQVLSGDHYRKEAQNNQVREVTVQAPRGEVLDRQGHTLVGDRTALALQVRPDELPNAKRRRDAELKRVGGLVGMSLGQVQSEVRKQTKDLPANPVTLKRDVPYDLVYFLRENQGQFPGVTIDRVYVRTYPHGTLAAHILGYVREINAQQLKEPRYSSLAPGDQVGQAGVESTYDNVLRGINGDTRIQVDASGRPTGGELSSIEPQAGDDLKISIDEPVQAAGEAAIGSFPTPGAFVAMDLHDGQILGMGSSPTYDPTIFTHPVISPATYQQLSSQTTGAPIFDRAMQGGYPTGSTFKPITAIAALESGTITPSTTIVDGGSFTIGSETLHNAGGGSYGALQLQQAIQVSSDVFFYNLGADMNPEDNKSDGPLQKWAEDLGIGKPTGIDVPGESDSLYLLPTPEWRNDLYAKHQTDRPWSVGDNVNLAVGQGDVKTNPLQMAVAYAALANGGNVVRPHVGLQVLDPNGRVLQEINPAPQRHVDMNPAYTHVILAGMHDAAQAQGGTSCAVFCNYPVPIAGKTGTAERPPQADQSWYVAVAPYPNPRIVVAATIEQGGFGVDAAAPAVRQIFDAYFNVAKKKGSAGSTGTGTTTTPTTPSAGGGVNLYG
jgi:penicillin-binding protein 2